MTQPKLVKAMRIQLHTVEGFFESQAFGNELLFQSKNFHSVRVPNGNINIRITLVGEGKLRRDQEDTVKDKKNKRYPSIRTTRCPICVQ